ncbi:MAG: hypothetical protein FJ150_04835 [Euryarchaeota archaeon]|nr:hypothetical protein [Euryarchaeota archaeon]
MEKLSKVLAVLLITVAAGFIGYIVMFGFVGGEVERSDICLPTVSEDNVSAYKASCSELNVSMISDKSLGQRVKVKGEILKIRENFDNTTDIELKVPELSPNPYILVTYSTRIPYKEGDKIEVYGEYGPSTSQEDLPKNTVVPLIKAVYIEKI